MSENYIITNGDKGSINISEDVIAVMVAAAISEVEGVAGLSNNISTELSDFFGKKSISKGIKVQFVDERIIIDTVIMIRFGFPITTIAERVQSSVSSAVESMTGIGEPIVNVHVGGVAFDKN